MSVLMKPRNIPVCGLSFPSRLFDQKGCPGIASTRVDRGCAVFRESLPGHLNRFRAGVRCLKIRSRQNVRPVLRLVGYDPGFRAQRRLQASGALTASNTDF